MICMEKIYFNKDDVIVEEGTLSDGAYIIESGKVEVFKKLPNGQTQQIARLDKNDIFGEMGLIDQLPRSATVIALEDCCISIMTPDSFNSLAKSNPKALMPVLKILAKRLRNTLKIIENVEGYKSHNNAIVAGNI